MNSLTRISLFPIVTLALGLLLDSVPTHSGIPPSSYPYPEHLTGTFTGGFGEDTCHSCHFDYPLNHEEGNLQLEGFPSEYQSGQSYMIRIHIERPELAKAGFQIATRFSDGRQAGMFSPQSDRTQFTESAPEGLQYLQHSAKGTEINGENTNTWQLKWIAPSSSTQDTVYVNLSANAANGDASEFGDFIFTKELLVNPSE
ncbi:MAG: choice-of-anchor V domain-containing protein [Balneolaceae bacterium]|nr:choice-of-anchor V domain-containing protein [Balneolaceae bacterium]